MIKLFSLIHCFRICRIATATQVLTDILIQMDLTPFSLLCFVKYEPLWFNV